MDRSAEVFVRARGLSKEYGSGTGLIRAVDRVDLEISRGEALAVRGPSGCGKSTLLHLLGGLDRPTAGETWLNGRRIDRLSERALARLRRREVGFVFQAFHLMDELSAQENVELPALLAGRSPAEARRRAGRAPRARRARRPGRSSSLGAVRRRAAASRHRPGAGQRAEHHASPTNPPATWTAPPLWRCCGSSRPARGWPDARRRDPRRADRGDRGPAGLDARRHLRRRHIADGTSAGRRRRPQRSGGMSHGKGS